PRSHARSPRSSWHLAQPRHGRCDWSPEGPPGRSLDRPQRQERSKSFADLSCLSAIESVSPTGPSRPPRLGDLPYNLHIPHQFSCIAAIPICGTLVLQLTLQTGLNRLAEQLEALVGRKLRTGYRRGQVAFALTLDSGHARSVLLHSDRLQDNATFAVAR